MKGDVKSVLFTGQAWWGWFLTGAGFFLTAAGVPVSSFALFAFAVRLAQDGGLTWQEAAAFTGSATVAGHVASYYAFRWVGQRVCDHLEKLWPDLPLLIGKAQHYLGRGWPLALILRWAGTGYTQVFWLMGMSRKPWYPVICVFFANDYAWATFWCAAIAYAVTRVPVLHQYLLTGGLFILLVSTGAILFARSRRA